MEIIVKGGTSRQYVPNIERVCEIAREIAKRERSAEDAIGLKAAIESHKESLKRDREGNGFTREKNFRRIGRVPAKEMREFRASHGEISDKDMKRFLRDGQFNTVDRNSF